MAAKIASFAEILDLWPSHEAFAHDIGVKASLPPVWKHRDMIPSKYWLAVVEAARARGVEGLSLDLLAALAVDEPAVGDAAPAAARALRAKPAGRKIGFTKILVANRGEIACRVMRTARRLGLKTVAVYSEADRDALHVEMADEAHAIGPAPAAESYLAAENILNAVHESGADAVHPGYGFLAENADFARALETAGVAFIGPPPAAIAQMGDKIESKKIALEAGVNTIPGHGEALADARAALAAAKEIGYPVMLKAAAGGGGKGLRLAASAREVEDGFRAAASEAKSSFGDDRVFVEKFIADPRHIEIQIMADGHGNVIHLGERECSLQRRHQKIIEEAPSPAVDEALRAEMGAQAVTLAKAVGYRSAGTVEFIAAPDKSFYFLEMNTRLQVEHPVTEFVTGLDLVELMIRVAAGEELPLTQADVKFDGWAIEARIYAENPFREFLPSTGRLVRFAPPAEGDGVRVDTGVAEGDEISVYYDPMIAKLIAHGADRAAAAARLGAALDAFYVRGISHNVSFVAALVAHKRFLEGRLSTGFIAEEYPDGFSGADLPADDERALIATAAAVQLRMVAREIEISDQLPGHEAKLPDGFVVVMGGRNHPVRVNPRRDGCEVKVANATIQIVTDWRPGDPLFRASLDGRGVCVQVDRSGPGYRMFHAGAVHEVRVLSARTAELAARMPDKPPPDTSKFLLSPMPGLLVSLAVAPGQEVKVGDELAVVEAMKMENVLRAERDGTVGQVLARPGDSLAVDQAILEFA